MQPGALRPYEHALTLGRPLMMRHRDGRSTFLDIPRWLAAADDADDTVIERAIGPVLDIGCGPGRLLAALQRRGLRAVGVDIAERAIEIATEQGLIAIRADIFDASVSMGHWCTALLLDGNIGIGGDPPRLLRRAAVLLRPRGRLIVETHHDVNTDRRGRVRFARGSTTIGPDFPWAEVGLDALNRYAGATGLAITDRWSVGGRSFAQLLALGSDG